MEQGFFLNQRFFILPKNKNGCGHISHKDPKDSILCNQRSKLYIWDDFGREKT